VNANGATIPQVKTAGISRKSWNLKNIVPLTGSIPFIRKQRLNSKTMGVYAVLLM